MWSNVCCDIRWAEDIRTLRWYPSIITLYIYPLQRCIYTIYIVNALASNPWMDARRKDLEILHQAPPPMCLTIFCVPDVSFIWLDFPGISCLHTACNQRRWWRLWNMCTYLLRALVICNEVPPLKKELEQKIVGKQLFLEILTLVHIEQVSMPWVQG